MKIATLIPAYKPKYLIELLTSLRNQTVKPASIVFSDDSPDQAFVATLSSEPLKSLIADLNVSVVPGPRSGAYNNFRHLLKLWGGETELFHLLLDDDIIYPSFYERHLLAHSARPISCSVSRRWTANEAGQPLRDLALPAAIDSHGSRLLAIDPQVLFSTTAAVSSNWLGEFSNVVLAAPMADMVADPRLDGIAYTGLEDLGAFLNASLRAPIGFINDHLGYFRTSTQQNSADPMGRPMKLAHLAYVALAIAGRRIGKISVDQTQRCLTGLCPLIVQRYGTQDDMLVFNDVMAELAAGQPDAEANFIRIWHAYLA